MKELGITEIKKLALDILKSIALFCDTNQLQYFLAYGTMLGAVRHHGFIPWDDDIDIIMPRPDYEKFLKTYNGFNPNYYIASIENDFNYTYTMSKVFDLRTKLKDLTLWKSYPKGGVFVDVFPIDGLPDSPVAQNKLFQHQQLLNLIYHSSCMKYTYSRHYVDSKNKLAKIKGFIRTFLKFGAVTLMHPIPTNKILLKINRDAQTFPFIQAKYKSVLIDCASGNKREVLPAELFAERKKYKFEDQEFWGFANSDFYLKHLFNNYMEMPPEDRRVSHHNFKVYWR